MWAKLGAFAVLVVSALCFFIGYFGYLIIAKDDFIHELLINIKAKAERTVKNQKR